MSTVTGRVPLGGETLHVLTAEGLTSQPSFSEYQLEYNREYIFRVAACNVVGWGPWSKPFVYATAAEVPDAPVHVELSSRDQRWLEVAWAEPEVNGSSVVRYELELSTGCRQLVQRATVRVRSPYDQYDQDHDPILNDVVVVHGDGDGDGDDETDANSNSKGKKGKGGGKTPASTHSNSGRGGIIESSCTISAGSTPHFKFESLHPFEQYCLRVCAVNGIGRSPKSDMLVLTTLPGPPDAPATEPFTAHSLKHGRAVTALWVEPRNNGAPITSYRVEFLDHRERAVAEDGSIHPGERAEHWQEVRAGGRRRAATPCLETPQGETAGIPAARTIGAAVGAAVVPPSSIPTPPPLLRATATPGSGQAAGEPSAEAEGRAVAGLLVAAAAGAAGAVGTAAAAAAGALREAAVPRSLEGVAAVAAEHTVAGVATASTAVGEGTAAHGAASSVVHAAGGAPCWRAGELWRERWRVGERCRAGEGGGDA